MAEKTQKNRRSRNAKISEYRLRKLVMCFAKNLTARETAAETRLTEPTVRHRFMQIRQLLFEHGPMRVDVKNVEGRAPKERPAKYIYERQYKGVKQKYAHLFEIEVLNRIFATKNVNMVKRFAAWNDSHMKEVMRYVDYNKLHAKYDIVEILNDASGVPHSQREQRPFEPFDYETDSLIVVNEHNVAPDEAFFRVIWELMRKFPLQDNEGQA